MSEEDWYAPHKLVLEGMEKLAPHEKLKILEEQREARWALGFDEALKETEEWLEAFINEKKIGDFI